MGYRTLDLTKRASRLTETIGVTGKGLCAAGNKFVFHSTKLMKSIAPGRYHITGRDGAFWLTDIRYNEK